MEVLLFLEECEDVFGLGFLGINDLGVLVKLVG